MPASHAFGLACLLSGIRARATAILVDVTSSLEPLIAALRAQSSGGPARLPGAVSPVVRRVRRRPALRTGLTAGSLCPAEVLEDLDASTTRAS